MQLTSAPSPAAAFIAGNQFLVQPQGAYPAPALEMRATAPDTVELIVADPWAEDNGGDPEPAHFYADTAASVLEPVVNGVKLIVKTADGYVGQAGYFSGDEQYFANALPGLTHQAAEVGWDQNGDGEIGDDESAFVFPVASKADAARLDPIVRDQMGDYKVVFDVEG